MTKRDLKDARTPDAVEHLIIPDWAAPARVGACTTTRAGGVSQAPFASFNLGLHVGDDPRHVESNRERLMAEPGLPSSPVWLEQVHGCTVIDAAERAPGATADAALSRAAGTVCAVLTADCLPVLLCDRSGRGVAAVHAGWRGLAAGVIEAATARLCDACGVTGRDILAWLGPAIGPEAFEVGGEVRGALLAKYPAAGDAFRPSAGGRWLADLYALGRAALAARGVTEISGGGWCTYQDAARFYSYRRDGTTGRMATLIWLRP